jgi:hypothetical protein
VCRRKFSYKISRISCVSRSRVSSFRRKDRVPGFEWSDRTIGFDAWVSIVSTPFPSRFLIPLAAQRHPLARALSHTSAHPLAYPANAQPLESHRPLLSRRLTKALSTFAGYNMSRCGASPWLDTRLLTTWLLLALALPAPVARATKLPSTALAVVVPAMNATEDEPPRNATMPCNEARLKCAFRTGCGRALQFYLTHCASQLQGDVSDCPEICQYALIGLMSTDQGKELMTVSPRQLRLPDTGLTGLSGLPGLPVPAPRRPPILMGPLTRPSGPPSQLNWDSLRLAWCSLLLGFTIAPLASRFYSLMPAPILVKSIFSSRRAAFGYRVRNTKGRALV